jgi:GMP synthase (glutamine-hydrolysing)
VRVLAIVHEEGASPGVFAEAIAAAGHELEEWWPPEAAEPAADPVDYDAVLTLGGAMNVDQGEQHPWLAPQGELLAGLIERGTPLLGLCLGGQLVAGAAGAAVRRASRPEIGWHEVRLTGEGRADPLLAPLAPSFEAFQWHSYEFALPPGAVALAESEVCLQAARIGERAWAIQFHPEVSAADARSWIADYRSDPDAVRIGLDPTALAAETDAKIAAFNQLGRDLCTRWLDLARRWAEMSPHR